MNDKNIHTSYEPETEYDESYTQFGCLLVIMALVAVILILKLIYIFLF